MKAIWAWSGSCKAIARWNEPLPKAESPSGLVGHLLEFWHPREGHQ